MEKEDIISALYKMTSEDIGIILAEGQQAYEAARHREETKVLEDMARLAKSQGFDFEELITRRAQHIAETQTGEPVRFRDPNNPSLTWTGRGRLPSWLIKVRDDGGDIEKFRIRS